MADDEVVTRARIDERARIWVNQSSRMKGDRFVCGDCSTVWFSTAIGAPFEQDRCRCGGRLTAVWDVFPTTPANSPATVWVHDESGWRVVPGATIQSGSSDGLVGRR